ncbi:MAG: VIT domain-containing protein, partial [Pirellulaceae bacterium]|nr:VIT domain-containing protein [Pirellulaceae bacterium]
DGSAHAESIGALAAKNTGQEVSLAVGYHKVGVEIRDQIARTTIEESFVNNTGGVLEGVFYFPLPEDASISGFGMWINGALIEADVVEKHRAREIYETILREKRDPGLLEWTGGNIFKARVFPINPRSEKRIRIVYTQVLPLRANRYRYSYGLRSELLQKTPVRELSIDVQVHSALPLKSVTCPTHTVRTQQTDHSARVEFSAQEYTPERDFEVAFELGERQADVVVVPHQRGDDGYLLVQLSPPGPSGDWKRETLPDGDPVNLLIVCDSSASMDSTKRADQSQFVATLLASLGPKDQFNVAVSDVDCDWLFEDPATATADSIAGVRDRLAERISLGWTDLDRMTQSVLERLEPGAHVIYVGDGIVTARDADAQAFIGRLKTLTSKERGGSFHAVAVGNSFESTVLRALSRVGGGSMRKIGGEQTPSRVAHELLNEIAQPALSDLKVEFRGLTLAAVYPDQLPNLASGAQQILVGRYLPQGEDQEGEIIVTGKRDGKEVRFASRISLRDAERGNSFIPRLWARSHLDHLLAQGGSSLVKDEIISLSEEFHIITPYTSLLVLETDEDRERFGVKRRYQMRDGERFFATGRDNANFELLQQQMKRASDWRLELRRRTLLELTQLGRNAQLFQQMAYEYSSFASGPMSGPMSLDWSGAYYGDALGGLGGGLGFGGGGGSGAFGAGGANGFAGEYLSASLQPAPMDSLRGELKSDLRKSLEEFDEEGDAKREWGLDQDGVASEFGDLNNLATFGSRRRGLRAMERAAKPKRAASLAQNRYNWNSPGGGNYSQYGQWLSTLFPAVPSSSDDGEIESEWSGAALEISQSLVQAMELGNRGVEVRQHTESRDPRWNRDTGAVDRVQLYSSKQWLHFTDSAGSQTVVHWCDAKNRGVYARALQLGRARAVNEHDYASFDPGRRPYAVIAIHEQFATNKVSIARPAADRAVLTMTNEDNPDSAYRLTVDLERNVLLKEERLAKGKVASTTVFSEYSRAAGVWWPGKIELFNAKSQLTSTTTQTAKVLAPEAFANRYREESPKKDEAFILTTPLPTTRAARVAAANDEASAEHLIVLLLLASKVQKWDLALERLVELEELVQKPGMAWVRAGVLIDARKNDDLRLLVQQLADGVVKAKPANELFLANHAVGQASSVVDANERLELLDRLRPIYTRQPAVANAEQAWDRLRVQLLRQLGRADEALELQRSLAAKALWDMNAQVTYANDLANAGEFDAAYEWLRGRLDTEVELGAYEEEQLRNGYVQLLERQGRDQAAVKFFEEWIARKPTNEQVYQKYLAALLRAKDGKRANEVALKWLVEGRNERKQETHEVVRQRAVISYALGQRYRHYMNWLDPIWVKPLEESASYFLTHEHHFEFARRILGHHYFNNTDEADRVRAAAAKILSADAANMDEGRLNTIVSWVVGQPIHSKAEWNDIAGRLKKRWDAEKDNAKRYSLGETIRTIYAAHHRDSAQLPFMRERIARDAKSKEKQFVDTLRIQLFNELLSRPWSAELEAEAGGLIEQLHSASRDGQRLAQRIHTLHRYVDGFLRNRITAATKVFQDTQRPEKLTRNDWSKKQREFQTAAREGVAERLATLAEKLQDEELRHWTEMERLYLDIKLRRNLPQAAASCWRIVGEQPRAFVDAAKVD